MALSSAFRERLEYMERTRNERLSLLQVEKELQANKSEVLASKLENIRSMERRCSILDQKIAFQNFKISALKSETESLDAKYQASSQQLRILKSEVAELEELEKEKERFYEVKAFEMKEFRQNVERFEKECRLQVEDLRKCVSELRSTFMELQSSNGDLTDSQVAAAETRKAELLAIKEILAKSLASNYQVRAQLQKQLQDLFMNHDK